MPVIQLTKLSILTFYLRLSIDTYFRAAVYTIAFMCGGLGIGAPFATIFQCNPVIKGVHYNVPGKCFNQLLFYRLASIFNVVLDFMIFLLPAHILYGLRMSKRQIWALRAVFSVGML
jgi:hypothetical protein